MNECLYCTYMYVRSHSLLETRKGVALWKQFNFHHKAGGIYHLPTVQAELQHGIPSTDFRMRMDICRRVSYSPRRTDQLVDLTSSREISMISAVYFRQVMKYILNDGLLWKVILESQLTARQLFEEGINLLTQEPIRIGQLHFPKRWMQITNANSDIWQSPITWRGRAA